MEFSIPPLFERAGARGAALRRSRSRQNDYVSNQPGYLLTFLCVMVAVILGSFVRVYFAPERVRAWVMQGLERESGLVQIHVKEAALSLASGSWPQLAVRLNGIRGFLPTNCTTDPAFEVTEMDLPLRLRDLIRGRLAIGTVLGTEAVLNTRAFRRDCSTVAKDAEPPHPGEEVSPKSGLKLDTERAASAPAPLKVPQMFGHLTEARPKVRNLNSWWTEPHLRKLTSLLSGLEIKSVRILLEGEGERVLHLEDLRLSSRRQDAVIDLRTSIRIPPAVAFGESLTPLRIDLRLDPRNMTAAITGNLKEGRLEVTAALERKGPDEIDAKTRVRLTSAPLATLIPALRDWNLIHVDVKPRFMWLSCDALVEGPLEGFFLRHPLQISDCRLDGEAGRVTIASMTRQPDGSWDPFRVSVADLDLRRVATMLGREGPNGILSNFGRLSGDLDVDGAGHAVFSGSVRDLEILFSNQSVRGRQRVPAVGLRWAFGQDGLTGAIERAELQNGRMIGRTTFNFNRDLTDGLIQVEIEDLVFDPSIQKLMLHGQAENLAAYGQIKIESGKVARWQGEVGLEKVAGPHYRFEKFKAKTEASDGLVRIQVLVKDAAMSRTSPWFALLEPVFLGHTFKGESVEVKDIGGRFQLDGERLGWERVVAYLDGHRVTLSSTGGWDADHRLHGWLSVDLPGSKLLRWDLGGHFSSPQMAPGARARREMEKRKGKTAGRDSQLQTLGRKVIERAKGMLPQLGEGAESSLEAPAATQPTQ